MSHSLFDFNPFRHCNHLIKCYMSFLPRHSQSVICHSPVVTVKKYDCLMILDPRNMMLGLALQITTWFLTVNHVVWSCVYSEKENINWDMWQIWEANGRSGRKKLKKNSSFTFLPELMQNTMNTYLVHADIYFF